MSKYLRFAVALAGVRIAAYVWFTALSLQCFTSSRFSRVALATFQMRVSVQSQ
jgi:hypothetical protein